MAFIFFIFYSLVLAIWAAFDNRAATISALIALLAGAVIYLKGAKEISFDGHILRVGRANIESRYLGEVTVLAQSDFLLARTRLADPAAYSALIFWVSRGVKVEINDARDATPYWLISTKRGDELARALKN
jgi:hypothetical protein